MGPGTLEGVLKTENTKGTNRKHWTLEWNNNNSTMNFIAQVEEHLRDLGTEARKKHPGVKEASERAILTLRSLQSRYISAVRAATASNTTSGSTPKKHPTTSLFRSQDVLRPFLLACNYPDASSELILVGISAMQLLIRGDAVCPEDSVHIARVLGIQAACCCRHNGNEINSQRAQGGVMASLMGAAAPGGSYSSSSGLSGSGNRGAKENETISLKLLQTLTMIFTSKGLILGEEVLGQAITVCLTIISGNEGTRDDRQRRRFQRSVSDSTANSAGHPASIGGNVNIRRAAAATLKQILILTFDRATSDDGDNEEQLKATKHAAARAFSDLCSLAENRSDDETKIAVGPFSIHGGAGVKRNSVQPPPQSACFELVDMILHQKTSFFLGEVSEEQKHKVVNNEDADLSDCFPALLRYRTCPLVSTFLLGECALESKRDKTSRKTNEKKNLSNKDFSLLTRSTRLASTVVLKFGRTKEFSGECHIILTALIRFVSSSSEAYRNADHFEDGYIYSSTSFSQQVDFSQSSGLIPNHLLWRSALALESLYCITANPLMLKSLKTSLDIQRPNATLIAVIAEAVSSFATIAASNKSSILSVVSVVSERKDQKWDNSVKGNDKTSILQPQIFARARNITKFYDDWESSPTENNFNTFNAENNPSVDRLLSDRNSSIPYCNEGEAIWIAFNCTLSLASSLRELSTEDSGEIHSLVEIAFAPSLSVLQHFLKRFPAQNEIRAKALDGYRDLAAASIPLSSVHNEVQIEALFKSLCKLALPGQGQSHSSSFQDQHAAIVQLLLELTHCYHDHIFSVWQIILSTLEKLSILPVASPALSKIGHNIASNISDVFNRLSSFTTCFTDKSLQFFIGALLELSKHAIFPSANSPFSKRKATNNSDNEESNSGSTNTVSLSGKLISFAGRAFINSYNTSSDSLENDSFSQQNYSSKTFAEDFLNSIFNRLAITKPTTKKEAFQTLPFSLIALTDVTLSNSFRFTSFADPVTNYLCELAATSQNIDVRAYSMDTLASLITTRLAENGTHYTMKNICSVPLQDTSDTNYFAVEQSEKAKDSEDGKDSKDDMDMSQAELLRPLCNTITETPAKDAAEAGLNALHVILESSGHNLSGDAWPVIISAISSLSGVEQNRNSQSWSACASLSFRCLRLIVNDFLDQLPVPPSPHAAPTRNSLLHCCASFGQSQFDINTSLTAIGMLWTIADTNPSPNALEDVSSKLAFLVCDERAEVRNCSVNTLFSCIVGRGHRFTSEQWKMCIRGTIFGVLDKVTDQMGNTDNGASAQESMSSSQSSRYHVTVHHSRDSNSKQWYGTQVLTLRGMERVLRQFFSKLIVTEIGSGEEWFRDAWARIVDLALSCSNIKGGRETLDLRIAGVDMLILCCQLACEQGITAMPVRVTKNMQVVNGALRSVHSPSTQSTSQSFDTSVLDDDEQERFHETREVLFLKAFCSLESYIDDLDKFEDEDQKSFYSEPTLLQVLTKLSSGLTKLYDCCKDVELAPNPSTDLTQEEESDDLENRLVYMVKNVALYAMSDENSKFLNQAQRTCLELLGNMCLCGSENAFDMLASMGGTSFFCGSSSDDSAHGSEIRSGLDVLEFEAAKTLSDVFVKEGVSRFAKALGLLKILESFAETRNGVNENYNLLVSLFQGGLEAASFIEKESRETVSKSTNTSSFVLASKHLEMIKDLWKLVVSALSYLLSPAISEDATFAPHTNDILEILSSCALFVPKWISVGMGEALAKGAMRAKSIAKNHGYRQDSESKIHSEDALKLFEACYIGLGRCQPESEDLQAITESSFRDALGFSLKSETDIPEVYVDFEVATIICEALKSESFSRGGLIISNFSLLCQLINKDEEKIRRKAGGVLASVDVAGVLDASLRRAEIAEERAEAAEIQNQKLQLELNELRALVSEVPSGV